VPSTVDQLPPYAGKNKALRVIVESPRGSRVKYEYSPETGAFLLKRPLPAGLAYPFDWASFPARAPPTATPST